MTTELPDKPKSRKESYLADIAGQDVTLPDHPESREEQYLAYIAENGGGGGGGGTSNFNQLTNRPKYNNTDMTGDTNIPEVKAYTAGSGLTLTGTAFSVDTATIQPKLTAGSNVSISDNTISATDTKYTAGSNVSISDQNVISATDTTYSNFTGTDGTAVGAAGLVPAPATTDAGKFLKADGTWDDAAGSTYTAGDGIDITNDVISTTNTGKAKVLTAADYNYHNSGSTDDGIALWLLLPGIYTLGENLNIYYSSSGSGTSNSGFTFIVTKTSATGRTYTLFPDRTTSGAFRIQYTNSDGGSGSVSTVVMQSDVIDNLTSNKSSRPLSANQGKVLKDLVDSLAIRGAGAPTTATVGQVGTLYEDTTNGDLYICTDATNPYVWEEVGGGPAVVQTTGTSTTDVMSQNAVTSMVFADPSSLNNIKIGSGATSSSSANNQVVIGKTARGVSDAVTTIGYGTYVNGAGAVALGNGAQASAAGAVAIGNTANATVTGQFDIGSTNTSRGYNSSNYRLLTGLYDPQSAHDAATKGYVDGTDEAITIATGDWSALSSSDPYDYSVTVTLTATITANSTIELLNDQAVLFATNGFAIGSADTVNNTITIYSIGQPSASVTLNVNIK